MATFDSDQHQVNTKPGTLTAFLAIPSNLEQILPTERIENWQADGDTCSFKIKGLAEIHLRLESSDEHKVVYTSASDKPFPFKLIVKADGDDLTDLSASFDADVNSFMSMMLKAPLTNFLNSLGEAITKKFASS